jgi:6-pyruvoyltetrahydropterin/6-carboxytetrahydropterin synthase
MRLGVTETIDCAHVLPGHPKCGQLHGHTYTVEVQVEGEMSGGMVLDFADLKAQIRQVLARYDHRHWNDFLEYLTVEHICQRLADELAEQVEFPFSIRVYEGRGKWAETSATPSSEARAQAD